LVNDLIIHSRGKDQKPRKIRKERRKEKNDSR